MDPAAVERAQARLERAAAGRADTASVDAALERARAQVESLAAATADLEATLPARVGDAVREGVRAEALPVARQLAEVRGLLNLLVRRTERVEGDLAAERNARVDDLSLLVDLIASGWQGVDARLARLEQTLERAGSATVYHMDERRAETG